MKFLRHIALAVALFAPLQTAAVAQAGNWLPGVGMVAVGGGGSTVTLAIPGKAGAPYRVLWLSSPYRLVVDLQGHWLGAPKSSIYIGMGLVTQIRAARHVSGITRIVFDLSAPADMRADNRAGTLVLTVVPRGTVQGAAPIPAPLPGPVFAPPGMPGPPAMPGPVPTRRPVPNYPAYPPYGYPPPGYQPPVARVTPIPVMPPMGWTTPPPGPQPAYPGYQAAPAPVPMSTPPFQPAPMPMQTPPPGPVSPPPFSPEPLPSDFPLVDMPTGPKPVFGNRFLVGGGAALSLSETLTGVTDTSLGMVPNGGLTWDQMFTPSLGISLDAKFQGYKVEDEEAKTAGTPVTHRRDEIDGKLGIRGRFDLGGGLEVMAQPQFVVRKVGASSVFKPAGGAETPLPVDNYLSVGYLGYGGGLGAGLGYRLTDWFGLSLGGEFNYLLGGMDKPTVTSVLPLMNIGAGLETRFDFGGFATTVGYKFNSLSGGGLSQTWHGPQLNIGVAY